jgi:hypothetical protein
VADVAGGRDYDGAKFKELVLFLSLASADDEGFGMVKLNKLLFRADFEAYRLLGQAITGETYEKQEYGPVARSLPRALDELASRAYIVWQHVARGPYTRDVPAATEPPDVSLFSHREMEIVKTALHELSAHGGRSSSEWSHEVSAGWRVKGIGDAIPYSSSVINMRPLSARKRRQLHARLIERYGSL